MWASSLYHLYSTNACKKEGLREFLNIWKEHSTFFSYWFIYFQGKHIEGDQCRKAALTDLTVCEFKCTWSIHLLSPIPLR